MMTPASGPQMGRHAVQEGVARVVDRIARVRSLECPVPRDQDFRQLGFTSFDLVDLVLAVEAEFAMQIPDSELKSQMFRTVQTIEEVVVRLMTSDSGIQS